MKKVVSIIIVIMLICFGVKTYAEDEKNIDLSFTNQVKVEENQKDLVLTLAIENVKGMPDNISVGYQANVKYDKDIFESLKIEKLNNWTVNYNESTNNLTCELVNEKLSENKEIAKFTFKLKDNITKGETIVELTEKDNISAEITAQSADNTVNFSKVCSKKSSITIEGIEKEKTEDNNKDNTQQTSEETSNPEPKETKKENEQESTTKEQTQGTTTPKQVQQSQGAQNSNEKDTTTAQTEMPKTGIKTIVIIMVGFIAILGVTYLIKYKKIQIK